MIKSRKTSYTCHWRQCSSGSKKIEKDRNWGIGKDRTFLSLPTHHFASPKLYFFLSPHLSWVTRNIYLFLSLCLVISIFSHPVVYPPTEVVSIFFSIFRNRPLEYFSIPHLSPHRANFNLSLYPSVSILTTKWRVQFEKVLCRFYIEKDYYFIGFVSIGIGYYFILLHSTQ